MAIRDALYRGREDFVYRVTVRPRTPDESLFPFATLGRAPQGDVPAGYNPLLPSVDSQLPLCEDIAPNNTVKNAQQIALPQLVKGRIAQPGETHVYKFTGKAGETVVAEVYARRLGSPMDSLLRLSDAAGHVLAWNDDHENGEMGLITHQADSYLSTKLPATASTSCRCPMRCAMAATRITIICASRHRKRTSRSRMTPSGVNIPAGGTAPITVYAFRKDGWDGDIEITLKDPPAGFTLKNAHIPAGKDHADITLIGPNKKSDHPLTLQLEGHAQIAGNTLTRPVVPADRKMQAFAYYHLVPAQELLVMVMGTHNSRKLGTQFAPTTQHISRCERSGFRVPIT